MHCYLPYPCYTIWPPTSELFGHALGLALWGKLYAGTLSEGLTQFIGLYVCLFFLTIWRLRATRSKYTPALTGIIVLFVLNLIQTGERLVNLVYHLVSFLNVCTITSPLDDDAV